MREIITKIYNFDELSDKAKEKARQWFRLHDDSDYSDERNCVNAIANVLHSSKVDYYVGLDGISYVEFRVDLNDDILSLKGVRALKWVYNNWVFPTFKGKYFSKLVPCDKDKEHPMGVRVVKRYSKATPVFDCPLTGFCMDMNLFEAYGLIQQDVKEGKDVSVMGFLSLLEEKLCEEWLKECEYRDSDDYIDEMLQANYEFYEDGRIAG